MLIVERPWVRALAWAAFLGSFFFLTYNFANFAASERSYVPVLMFAWERSIPFLAWTIVPYWSSDVLYALSLFVCRTRAELDLHGKRLVAIQVFSVACFLAFPLRCSFERVTLDGWAGGLFGALLSFDKPFNQAPSLHASLAVILWDRYRRHTDGVLRVLTGGWFGLVALSSLTTYQHHFIDLPMGLWAGVLTLAALPERRRTEPQVRLTLIYLAGAVACTAGAFTLGGFGWLLLWPGFGLSMVSAAYWTGDPRWLAKRDGRVAFWMFPYTFGAWVNSRLWTKGRPAKALVADQVWIGRAPSGADREGMRSLVDLTAELPMQADACIPMLDLALPGEERIDDAVEAIMNLADRRPTLVCCALGYSRSAIVSAAWLIAAGYAECVDDALAQVKRARPQVVVGRELRLRLERWSEARRTA